MEYISDLHLHSCYSRATARDLNIEGLYKGAMIKGIDIIGTGDFTHPKYFKEINNELEDAGGGLYKFKRSAEVEADVVQKRDVKFLITAEIANIYKRAGQVRRIHTCIFAPGIAEAEELNNQLEKIGNIKSDGRPILGMDVEDMSRLIFDISEDFIIIPAHAWTPWFAIFGSKSGFDSIEECFGGLSEKIYAIETGLSSDPAMNWRWSHLDNISLVSNSDAHSLPNLGREATVFDLEEPSVKNIKNALNKKDSDKEAKDKISYTIEFYPQEGKYHFDGHRGCKFVCDPKETKRLKGICPKCKKPLTIGVDSRVEELADRKNPKLNGSYKYIVPLQEIIAGAFGQAKTTKKVQNIYNEMIKNVGDEFSILIKMPIDKIKEFPVTEISEGIRRVREGKVNIEPGYDGEYGVVSVFEKDEIISTKSRQKALF